MPSQISIFLDENVPSSSKSHNQNEQENGDSDQEDEVWLMLEYVVLFKWLEN